MISLENTTRMSIELLEQSANSEAHMDVLYLLGCLPGGVMDSQLKLMYGKEVTNSLEKLKALSFLEYEREKY